ncbi:hypothetical protein BGZ99_002218 [Dissophora globulifera]|uniref:N-acetyltransferase domain-containing protein n=1 Tax=Dissophora globulifera TaxID=979702 RepID=A0A9P6R1J5_9FUNG|nr:hypothetical protein BGZ99_002218 [Dissophora globulifera]
MDVFGSKLQAYPAGNFIALATTSVLTDEDTLTWSQDREQGEHVEEEEDEEGEDAEQVEESTTAAREQEGEAREREERGLYEVSVVEITETGPDGSSTTTTTTSATTGDGLTATNETIVRARTPDITLSNHDHATTSTGNTAADISGDRDRDDQDMTTILFQWEQPIGYLLSHPYSRESVTLHHLGDHHHNHHHHHHQHREGAVQEDPSQAKKMRLDEQSEPSSQSQGTTPAADYEEEEEEEEYEHDQGMEKYFIHDCAIHPDWRGKGLGAQLWKALEDSLTPLKDNGDDTPMESEEGEPEHHHHFHGLHRHHGGGRHHRGGQQRKGAPNLKEIVLVSVQGTQPFWQHAGGFAIVPDHDIDLSVYGDEAFLMSRRFGRL